jgi:glutamate synthase (NADPH/NADH) large chain
MTGGVVAVLGDTGRNFAAGMSGGVAYVYDDDGTFADRANTEMVSLSEELEERDRRMLRRLVENHAEYTGSERAETLLADWEAALADFVKVMPDAYAEVIAETESHDVRLQPPAGATPLTGDDATTRALGGAD